MKCSSEGRSVEFNSVKDLNDHAKAGHPLPKGIVEQEKALKPRIPKVPAVTKVTLEYKYTGKCGKCGREVDTIDIDLQDNMVMIAYCSSCKIQYKKIPVIPLSKQKIASQ